MTALVLLCCLACTQDGLQPPTSAPPPGPAPADVVVALETAISDAIARAEASVVAIHRDKAEHSQETLAVRGRRPVPQVLEPSPLDFQFRPQANSDDFISFDYGSRFSRRFTSYAGPPGCGSAPTASRPSKPRSSPPTPVATWPSSPRERAPGSIPRA
jgi:hypothetical protein